MSEPVDPVRPHIDRLNAVLARFPSDQRGYLSEAHRAANDAVAAHWRDAGLTTWQDAAGLLWARLPGSIPDAPGLVLGAPLSTPDRPDSPYGAAIAMALTLGLARESTRPACSLDVVLLPGSSAGDIGPPNLPARLLSGQFQSDWLAHTGAGNRPLSDALSAFGLTPHAVGDAALHPGAVAAFAEVHLDASGTLDDEHQPIGIASALAGHRRFDVSFTGGPRCTGSMPMHLRRDALTGAAEFLLIVERVAREHGVMATTGRVNTGPGRIDSIAGNATLDLTVHHDEDAARDAALGVIWDTARLAARERGIDMHWEEVRAVPGVACDDALQLSLAEAIERQARVPRYLINGSAEHTAHLAGRIPVVELLVRDSAPEPSSSGALADDSALALAVLTDWVRCFTPRQSSA